jgi:protease YdgD
MRAALAMLCLLLVAGGAAAQPQIELRPPPRWMTEPPGRPRVEMRPAPDWMPGQQAAPPAAPPAATPPAAAPAAPPSATPPPRIGIGKVDPRIPMDIAAAPWRGIGRVQRGGILCTGALIGPRTVLTAAHCLVGQGAEQRRVMPADSFRFLLGYHRGRWAAEARVVSIVLDPAFDARGARPGPEWADWALLRLDRAIGTPDRLLPLMRAFPPPGAPAMVAGYQQDRREILVGDPDCRVIGPRILGRGRPMLLHDCTATRGASGGPLLVARGDGGWAVAGVISTMMNGVSLGFAVSAEALPEGE